MNLRDIAKQIAFGYAIPCNVIAEAMRAALDAVEKALCEEDQDWHGTDIECFKHTIAELRKELE